MEKSIAVMDMKAFYSFVECIDRGLDPYTTPLVVCDKERGEGTVVLSVSPYLKKLGVPSRCRKRELPYIKDMVFATPRMQLYLEKSAQIMSIILSFVGEDDIHIYSIDEVFINLGPYLKMYNCNSKELVRKIQIEVEKNTGLIMTAGIAPNLFLAKIALDVDGKTNYPYIAQWTMDDVENKLWKVKPLTKLWGISDGYEKRLNNLGIFSIYQLATTPKEFLKSKLGVIGEQLHEHANGIDNSDIREKYIPENTSLSVGQVMHRDYNHIEMRLIIKEMVDDLCMRLRKEGKKAGRVSLSILYSLEINQSFSHQVLLDKNSDDTDYILNSILYIYDKYIKNYPIRRANVSASKLISSEYEQILLFEDGNKDKNKHNLNKVIDILKDRYGKDIILRASSLLESSTIKDRNNQIGGHRK